MGKSSKVENKPGPIDRTRAFAQEVKGEMDKVTWPSREDLKASTSVVLLFLLILAVIVGAMDIIFQNVVVWLLGLA